MGFVSSARVLATGAAWRMTGMTWAGRSLIDDFVHGDDNERTLAGMSLVQAGDRSVPLVASAIGSGSDPAELVDVIGSIGTDGAREVLAQLSESDDPATTAAAESALQDFDEIRKREA
ncbi:MAG: hypothetical protein GY788_22875 [bacterium]|nr:hypothetical protein [bacterium]